MLFKTQPTCPITSFRSSHQAAGGQIAAVRPALQPIYDDTVNNLLTNADVAQLGTAVQARINALNALPNALNAIQGHNQLAQLQALDQAIQAAAGQIAAVRPALQLFMMITVNNLLTMRM